jgi:hypothetical protein
MVLFPQIDTLYYTDEDRSIHQMMEHFYESSIQINQSFWSEADIDARFEAGDQTLWNDVYGNLPAFRRRQLTFNRIRRITNMIGGYQRQHRFSTIVTPVGNSDEQTADQLSRTLIHVNENGNVLETISEAFHGGALVSGMNLLSVWMDYRQDPINGDIRVDNTSYNEYLIDPFFKKLDLSDCRALWTRKWLSKVEIKSLLPDRDKEIDQIMPRGWRDGKFQFQPEAYNYAMQDLINYDEFYHLDYRQRKLLVDSITGETLEWKETKDSGERLAEFQGKFPQIMVVEQTIPTVKLAIVVNGRTMYHGPNPMGIDRYPFVPIVGYYTPHIPYFPWRVQGVTRGLRDAQYLYNRRKIIELDILESQINSGIKYKEDSLINPKDAFLTGQGRALGLKKEADMGDVEVMQPPQIPPSMIQLSEILGKEMEVISGVNEELLGSAVDDKSGILSMLRQGAGLTTLQILFDQLNTAQKYLGEICLDLIQANFSPGKIKRILGEEPTQQFYSRAFQKYNCVVEEGLNTSTQRQMSYAQLLALRESGIPVPTKVLIETSTMQGKKKLIEAIEQEEQKAAQQAEEVHQYQMALQQAQIESMKSKALADQGLGAERVARIEENRALAIERVAEAQNQRSLAAYHEIKASQELEHMDITGLEKLLGILHTIQESKRAAEQHDLALLQGHHQMKMQQQGQQQNVEKEMAQV